MALNCQEVRKIVQARGLLLDDGHGLDDAAVVKLTLKRDEYLLQVGLETYVSQMLGLADRCTVRMCSLFWPDGRVVRGSQLHSNQSPGWRVYVWICEKCRRDLPYKVEAHVGVDLDAVRYL